MKSVILIVSFCFLEITFCYSQDYLIKKNGDSLKVKIVEVGLNEVKYKEYSNLMGITYGVYKTEVIRIRYENGRVEDFSEGNMISTLSPEERCRCGKSDAAKYHGRKGAAFVCGAGCGLYAMLGTSIMNHTPKAGMRTTKMSENKNLFNDPYYLKCYNKKARNDLLNMELQGMIAVVVIPIVIVLTLIR